ncbi:hypothetical protein [Nesterenkonia alkaliphila]|uniref:DUF4386 family protein n=1 Tax=Nesterenkonia alkaliphila TaxID=1463631 RepID=A0A7K1UIN1_9MICC|nr:hypothetical protein [Nesterenkonia alkaliphila]MVT26340.1 hypothetical protein [Nesterenkonia alkaliphila]GFZ88487.1 hypothetical protein GCM10011359_17250 [Nesterenkonia alkaliphila]
MSVDTIEAGESQRRSLRFWIIAAIVVALLTAPRAAAVTEAVAIDLRHIAEGGYSVNPVWVDVLGLLIRLVLHTVPFLASVTLALVLIRKSRKGRLSSRGLRFLNISSRVGALVTGGLATALTVGAAVCAAAALYLLLGIGDLHLQEEAWMEQWGLAAAVPIDLLMVAWTVPGIVLGIAGRATNHRLRKLATAALWVCLASLVMSFLRAGAVLQLLVWMFYGILREMVGAGFGA